MFFVFWAKSPPAHLGLHISTHDYFSSASDIFTSVEDVGDVTAVIDSS